MRAMQPFELEEAVENALGALEGLPGLGQQIIGDIAEETRRTYERLSALVGKPGYEEGVKAGRDALVQFAAGKVVDAADSFDSAVFASWGPQFDAILRLTSTILALTA